MPVEPTVFLQQERIHQHRRHVPDRRPQTVLIVGCQGDAKQLAIVHAGTALGSAELDAETPEGRSIEEQYQARQKAAAEKLEEIRASMHKQDNA